MRAFIVTIIVLAAVATGAWLARDWVRRHPQDVPWTELDLTHPTGRFTRTKLIKLTEDPRRCRAPASVTGRRMRSGPHPNAALTTAWC